MIHELACIGTRKAELLRLALDDRLGFYDAAVAFGSIKTAARLLGIEEAELQRVRASADPHDGRNVWAVPDAETSYDSLLSDLVARLKCGELVAEAVEISEDGEVAAGPPDWQPVESTAWAGAEWRRSASPDMFRSPVSVLLGDRRRLQYVRVRVAIGADGPAGWTETDDALPQLVPAALWQVLTDMRQAVADVGGPEALRDIARTVAGYPGGTLILMPQEKALIELHDATGRVESLLWEVVHGMLLAGTVRARSPVEHGSGAWEEWQPEKWRRYRIEVARDPDGLGQVQIISNDQRQPDGTLTRLPANYFQFSPKAGRSSSSEPHNTLMQIGQPTKRLGGQPRYLTTDMPLIAEMHESISNGSCRSMWEAARLVATRAEGGGTFYSKCARLCERYKEVYRDQIQVQNGSVLNRSEQT